MIPVDVLTADRLAVTMHGRHDKENDIVHPGIALSQPIVKSLFSKNGQLLFDEKRAHQRCACGHLGPPFDKSKTCNDCGIEHDELNAWQLFRVLRRTLELNGILMDVLRHRPDLLRDPRRQFWQLRWRHICWRDVGENPWLLLNSGQSNQASDDIAINHSELPDALAGRDDVRRDESNRREVAELMHYHLGIPTPFVRVYDPTVKHNLVGIPSAVAAAICRICREYEGQTLRGMRPVSTKIRQACKPLDDYSVTTTSTAVVLKFNGRPYDLLRHDKDPPTRNVSPGTGKSAGCAARLLGESENVLKKEIAYFKKNGRLKKHVRRFIGPNPFVRKAKEDMLSVEDCFIGSRKPARQRDSIPPVRTHKRKKRRRSRAE